jgi:hypothetical protein
MSGCTVKPVSVDDYDRTAPSDRLLCWNGILAPEPADNETG